MKGMEKVSAIKGVIAGVTMTEPIIMMRALCFLALMVAPFQVLANLSSEAVLDMDFTHGGVRLNLLSHDHVDSPFSNPHQPRARSERISNAVQRSRQRQHFINVEARQVHSASAFGSKAYTSPRVYPDNGTYVMEITLGTPPRTLVAIADTGSDLVWINCRGCIDCTEQPDPLFDPARSSSYSIVSCADPKCWPFALDYLFDNPCPSNGTGPCPYEVLYADLDETLGTFSKETITLLSTDGSTSSFPGFYFGCGYNASGFLVQYDGLVGLGRGDLSLVTQLGPQINHTFSYCLVDAESGISKASSLILGSTNGRKLTLAYTPLLRNIYYPSFYYVSVTGITINGKKLDYPEGSFTLDDTGFGGTILDSGTTLTFLPTDVYLPFLKEIQEQINYPLAFALTFGLDLCYNLSGIYKPKYPTVVFTLQGVKITLANDNLFSIVDDAGEIACLAFEQSSGISILGNIWQQNLYLVFDLEKNRIGIAPTKC